MTRHTLHRRACAAVATLLRRRGFHVRAEPQPSAIALRVRLHGGRRELTLAVRVATPRLERHQVCVGGVQYRYRYLSHSFCLHSHGKPPRHRPDIWVLVPAGRPSQALVIPATVMGERLTVSLPVERRRQGSCSPLRAYVGAWGQLAVGR